MKPLNPRVAGVTAEPGYRLRLEFSNGETRLFDCTHLLDKGVFRDLRPPAAFASVRPWHGTVQWSGGQDLCPDSLYEDSVPLAPSQRGEAAVVCEDAASYAPVPPRERRMGKSA